MFLFKKCKWKTIATPRQVETNVPFDSTTEYGFSFARKVKKFWDFLQNVL